MIFFSKKAKTHIFTTFYNTFIFPSYWFHIMIFETKKAKIAKNIFDKTLATGILIASIPITAFFTL